MFLPSAVLQHSAELSLQNFLVALIAILASAKIMGELAERVGQPAVLGELLAGVIVGSSVLQLVDPRVVPIHLLAELGVIILLFQIGLETDLNKLLRVGGVSFTVAVVGVVVPFALGWAVARGFGLGGLQAIVVGAALTATSVGITARVLADLGKLHSPEGQVILGAAVIDDVLGLIILAVVSQLVAGAAPGVLAVTRITAVAFGFLILAILLGRVIGLRLFDLLARIGRPESLAVMALAFAFVLALLADAAGSAMIVGAFAAGLVLQPSKHRQTIEDAIVRLGLFVVPIFFVVVGASVDVRAFASQRILLLGLSLLGVAILGKFVAGYGAWWFRGRKALVGVGMIPRGEVGLIFAQLGLSAAVLDAALFTSVMVMVMGTTLVAPPVLKMVVGKQRPTPAARGEDAGGVADLTSEI